MADSLRYNQALQKELESLVHVHQHAAKRLEAAARGQTLGNVRLEATLSEYNRGAAPAVNHNAVCSGQGEQSD